MLVSDIVDASIKIDLPVFDLGFEAHFRSEYQVINANKQFIMAAIAYNLKTCLPQAGVPEV